MHPLHEAFARELIKVGARAARSTVTTGSSNVRGFRYDPVAKQLFVTFKSGGTYRYDGVPPKAARALERAKSVGKAVHKHVKAPGYVYEKVGAPTLDSTPKRLGRQMLEMLVQKQVERLFEEGGLPKEASAIATTFAGAGRALRKLAGVAKKQVTWQGLAMKIEYEPGDIRSGTSKDGKKWAREMYDSYGYVPGTKGKAADGDAIDVYLAKEPTDGPVFKVHQIKKDGDYDEDKFMVGYGSAEQAEKGYLRHMPKWAFGGIAQVGESFDDFKNYVRN